ncbi:amidohydrolase [Natroniella sulfidigena]|uniref:amidohydrolase n=1 Tax=Natroniella sulfidigena TaxID=723921 RepID=UPI00200A7CCE|nr:amidohydrolase [Natroniella sulfidigena]MCK8816137.1 amidohydrolase [Natroniella sulfidigena]
MLAVKNGHVLTMTKQVIEQGTILIESGKIIEVGSEVEIPVNADIIDAEDKIVMPGLIDAHTHLGIWEEGVGKAGIDANEKSDPITPHLRAIDAVNPFDQAFSDALKAGVTTVGTGPGSSNVLNGESMALKTYGQVVDEMVVKDPVGAKAAFGENPKLVFGEQKKAPHTRMAVAALLREALLTADNYLKQEQQEYNIKHEAVAKVLRKEIPLKTHAHRADDIMTALRIAKEFDLDLTIEHGTEAHKIADYLAQQEIPVVFGPTMVSRSKVELKERDFSTAKVLVESGVKLAIMTDHPVIPIQYLSICAGLAVKAGLDRQQALEAITINPAQILGISDRVGSIEVGKDADLIILSGRPLALESNVEKVLLNGSLVVENGKIINNQ